MAPNACACREPTMACLTDAQRMRQYRRYARSLGAIPIWQKQGAVAGDGSPFFFLSGMAICVDGAPTAYGPRGAPTEDLICNAYRDPGQCTAARLRPERGGIQADWPGIEFRGGRPIVQGPNEPAPGSFVSQTSLQSSRYAAGDQRRYVDATRVPYVALPPALFGPIGYVRIGDLAVVINIRAGILCHAIWADNKVRPQFEGSVALAQALGINASPINGGTNDRILLCVVFPGSGDGQGSVPGNDTIRLTAGQNYEQGKWGAVLADCYGERAAQIAGARAVFVSDVNLLDLLRR